MLSSEPADGGATASAAVMAQGLHVPTLKRPLSYVQPAVAVANLTSEAPLAEESANAVDDSLLMEQPKRHRTSSAAATGSTGSHQTSAAAVAALKAAATASNSHPTQTHAVDSRIPAYHYIRGGSKGISSLLKGHNKQPSEAADLIQYGEECRGVLEQMQHEKHILLKYSHGKMINNQFMTKEVENRGIHTWSSLVVVGYEGKQPDQQDLQCAQEQLKSGELVSSHYCKTRQSEFEASSHLPHFFVESMMRISSVKTKSGPSIPTCFPHRQDGSMDVKVCGHNAKELSACRKAVFHITLVLMLLWHGQDKQRHPSLNALAEKLHLQPVAPQLPNRPKSNHAVCG